MKSSEVKTIGDQCKYIELFMHDIFVREFVDGKWQNMALAELPAEAAIKHTLRFIREGIIPIRLKGEENGGEDKG